MNAVETLQDVYKRLNRDSISEALLLEAYHQDVVFEDPFHKVVGVKALTEDFRGLYKNVPSIEFEYQSADLVGDVGYVCWKMSFIHPKMNKGQMITVDGLSKVEISDNKITHHRDYFDGGQMMYENVPVIGWGVRFLKKRLA